MVPRAMQYERTLRWGLPGLAGLVYLWRAWPSLWSTVDDAWISSRYAAQFAAGNGLVYNAGEPAVEGYTNLLWTVWLAVGIRLGADLTTWMVGSGLVLGLGTVLAAAGLTTALAGSKGAWWAPGAVALMVALDVHHAVVATNGLETSLFLFAATALAWAALRVTGRGLWLLGPLLGALAGIRPEGLMVGAVLASVVSTSSKHHERRDLLVLWAGTFSTWGALEMWRVWTYGAWVPNTFAAKANGTLDAHIWANLAYLRPDAVWWIGLSCALPLALFLGRRDLRRWALAAMALALVVVAFRVRLWMPGGRLLVPATVWITCLIGAGAASRFGKGLLVVGIAGALAAPFTSIETHVRRADYRHSVMLPNGTSRAAAHLAEHLPEGEWLAVRDAGVLAHFVGTEVAVAELHHRALTQPHPLGANTRVTLFTPRSPAVVALTQAREHASTVRYSGDRRVFRSVDEPYVYLGRVYQHYHRYYDLYVREDLGVPALPDEIVVNLEGPPAPR